MNIQTVNNDVMSSDGQTLAQLLNIYVDQQQYLRSINMDEINNEYEQVQSKELSEEEVFQWLEVEEYR